MTSDKPSALGTDERYTISGLRKPDTSPEQVAAEALAPCPFCGGEASPNGTVNYSEAHLRDQQWGQSTFFFCNCPSCGVSNQGIVGHQSRELAIAAWNRRQSPAGHANAVGWRLVPEAALKWLNGEGPDDHGKWFGDDIDLDAGYYWWRKRFFDMLTASPSPAGVVDWTVYDWEYTDPKTGHWSYARTPERAKTLLASGVELTPVYVPTPKLALQPATHPDTDGGGGPLDRVADVAVRECVKTLEAIQDAALSEDGDSDYYELASTGLKKIKALRVHPAPQAPDAQGGVDEIAKIIDPHSFLPDNSGDELIGEMVRQGMELARSKATRFLAALGPALQPAGVDGWRPSQGAQDVLAERRRQIEAEDFDTSHDDMATKGQLAGAAACYALTAVAHWAKDQAIKAFWPWDAEWWKPTTRRRDLVKAGALIIAELDRLDRLPSPSASHAAPQGGS